MFPPTRGSHFWSRHPMLNLGFFLAWSGIMLACSIGVLRQGGFHMNFWGSAVRIDRTQYVLLYWTAIVLPALAAALTLRMAIRMYLKNRAFR